MQDERKSQRSLRDSRNQKPKNLGKVTPGSRFLTLTTLDEIEGGNDTKSEDQLKGNDMKKGSSMKKNSGNLFGKKGRKVRSAKQGTSQTLGVNQVHNFGLEGQIEKSGYRRAWANSTC